MMRYRRDRARLNAVKNGKQLSGGTGKRRVANVARSSVKPVPKADLQYPSAAGLVKKRVGRRTVATRVVIGFSLQDITRGKMSGGRLPGLYENHRYGSHYA